MTTLTALLRAWRLRQWIKNGLIYAAWFFAMWDATQADKARHWQAFVTVTLATFAFSLVASAIYTINDIHDLEADRHHPTKRLRPIAAGQISIRLAATSAGLLASIGLTLAYILSPAYFAIVAFYFLLQLAYTYALKQVAFLDIFMIACGFVLRALAGAIVLDLRISPWFLLCVFFLSLYLALGKRRHEKLLDTGTDNTLHRAVLSHYTPQVLDTQIAITAAGLIVSYALYTLNPDTIARFHTDRLGFTIPIVTFGLFRYNHLIYNKSQGGAPETILYTDPGIIATILLYVAVLVLIFTTA